MKLINKNKFFIGFLASIIFSISFFCFYLTPIYSINLTVPKDVKISFNHIVMIIDASKQCRGAMHSNFYNTQTKVVLKTNNFDFGYTCINYLSSRIACESTFEFPYDKCESSDTEINQLSDMIKANGLDVLKIEKNNKFRYLLFYIICITFIFSLIYIRK